MPKYLTQPQGFTLIEVLSTLSLITIILLGLYRFHSSQDLISLHRSAHAQAQNLADHIHRTAMQGKTVDMTKYQSVFNTPYQLLSASRTTTVLQFQDGDGKSYRISTTLPKRSLQRADKCLLYRGC